MKTKIRMARMKKATNFAISTAMLATIVIRGPKMWVTHKLRKILIHVSPIRLAIRIYTLNLLSLSIFSNLAKVGKSSLASSDILFQSAYHLIMMIRKIAVPNTFIAISIFTRLHLLFLSFAWAHSIKLWVNATTDMRPRYIMIKN